MMCMIGGFFDNVDSNTSIRSGILATFSHEIGKWQWIVLSSDCKAESVIG